MLSDQISSILEDTSTIDKLKKTELIKSNNAFTLIKNVFNNESKIRWLIPLRLNINLTLESQY